MIGQEPPGSRDTGSDKPGAGVDRPGGTVDEDANPPLSDPDDDTVYGGTSTGTPQDVKPAIPPYEGRQTGEQSGGETAGSGAGASRPEEDTG
jgi:hypothetical protein